jgi:hypothetical protein
VYHIVYTKSLLKEYYGFYTIHFYSYHVFDFFGIYRDYHNLLYFDKNAIFRQIQLNIYHLHRNQNVMDNL